MNGKESCSCGCVLLAAGLGSRFGGNKLHADVNGISMIERALDTLSSAKLERVAVVANDSRILGAAKKHGFIPVHNPAPEQGISLSIKLGLELLLDLPSVMFMVADQPLLTKDSLFRLMTAHTKAPDSIAALGRNGKRGNPCIFPAELFPELLCLEGDTGGSAVIAAHGDRLILVEAGEEELRDVDDKQALDALNGCAAQTLHPGISIRLYTSDKCFGPGIAHLLCLVRECGSLRGAAGAMNMSYSKAWTTLCRCEELLGFKLLNRTSGGKNGGGAMLTEQAERILELYQEYCSAVEQSATELFREKFGDFIGE